MQRNHGKRRTTNHVIVEILINKEEREQKINNEVSKDCKEEQEDNSEEDFKDE